MTPFTAFRLHSADEGNAPHGRFEQLDTADLSEGDTLIKVAYSGLNYKDALAHAGKGKIVRSFPRIGGIDFSGHVVYSGDPGLKEGDPVVVHGFGAGVDHDGGYAHYARVPHQWVMRLPKGMALIDAATLGTAGYTAALALHWMESCGLEPTQGDIAVTGATGGVGSIAIDMLSARGFRVCAVSGKKDAEAYLKHLGAAEVLQPPTGPIPPLASARWSGAVDAVGGPVLAWLLSAMKPEGIVSAFGNAAGADLATTVFPFILRGVKLLGINANSPMALRRKVWDKLGAEYRPRHLADIRQLIALKDVPQALESMLARATQGRTVVDMAL